jgi:hypothetical protein
LIFSYRTHKKTIRIMTRLCTPTNQPCNSRPGLPSVTVLFTDLDTEGAASCLRNCNIIAALFNSLCCCARQAGDMIADILDRKTSIRQTIPRPARRVTLINMGAAKRMQISIPFVAMEAVDIVIN